jgi:ATP-binding cassette subfamily B protein
MIISAFKIAKDMRKELADKIYSMPLDFFKKHSSGSLMANIMNDVKAVRMLVGIGTIAFFDSIILSSFALGFMFYISPKLTLIALSPLPFVLILMYFFEFPMKKRFLKIQKIFGEISEKVKETVEGIALVKMYDLYGLKLKEFTSLNKKYKKNNLWVITVDYLFRPSIEFLLKITLLAILYYGFLKVAEFKIKIGDFIAFMRYMDIIIWPMIAVGWFFSLYQHAFSATSRIISVLNEKTEDFENGIEKEVFEGNIEFKNVWFKYPDEKKEYALKDFSLKIESKKVVGVTGEIGSGKSTFVKLILRLFSPEKGEINLDGKNINEYKLSFIRKNIAYVPQDMFLFSDTIRNNMRFADESITDEEIYEVLKKVKAYDFVNKFPEKLNTKIGERGITLSGGQRQRLAIARALLLKRPFLILDDALSAVDSETEKEILNSLKEFFKDTTVIIIGHRVSSFLNTDYIYVLDDGKVAEFGTHEELKEKSKIYKKIFERQKFENEL